MKLLLFFTSLFIAFGCAGSRPVKEQAYAKLRNDKTFEFEFPVVWKGIESALTNYRVVDRDPSDVDYLEMQKLKNRRLETEWVYGESRDKYVEYKIDGMPKKKYLQARYKYYIEAERVMGGTKVTVHTQEEIENLKADGSPNGYASVDQPDSSRANEMIEKINSAILAAAP